MKKKTSLVLSILTSAFLVGCGGGSSTTETTPTTPTTTTTSLTIVDPYIQDAVMYYDANDNGSYDDGEQLSDATNKYGNCTFTPALPEGSTVRMYSKGSHNGVPFDGNLSADLTGTGIVSPMTTLLEKFDGDSEAVITLLKDSGIELSAEDLTKDPMANIDVASSTLDNDIKRIQAAVAINTFLVAIGTNSTSTEINAAKTTLASTIKVTKASITSEKITSNSFESVVASTVAVSNYITEKIKLGDDTILTTLSSDDTTSLNTLLTPLITNYEENPESSYKLDSTKDIAEASGSITEAKIMTASQFFNFSGNILEIQYSGGHDGIWTYDNDGTDDLAAASMGFINIQRKDSVFTLKDIWFNWDWSDDNTNEITDEYVTESTLGTGNLTTSTNTIQSEGNIEMTYTDETSDSGTYTYKLTENGTTTLENVTFTLKNNTEVSTSKEIFISAEKVTEIAGVQVGDSTRDVYKVKTKQQWGLLDNSGNFVSSGDGYNEGYDCGLKDMTEYVNNDYNVPGSNGNSALKFGENGTFININTNKIEEDTKWEIVDGILQIRAYEDVDYKILDNGNCAGNWIGETGWSFTNVTKTEAESIMKALAPNYSNIFSIPTNISE